MPISQHKKCETIEKCLDERKANSSLYKNIEKQLNCEHYPININELKNFCYYGYCTQEFRPSLWRLMLGYHNTRNKFRNKLFFNERRKAYHEYLDKALDCLSDDTTLDKVIVNDVDRTTIQPIYMTTSDEITAKKCHFLDSKGYKGSHRDAIKRILLTFRVVNSKIGYVQGMSSLLIPIYFVFASSKKEEDAKYCEEDAFFCFFNLMTEIGEHFVGSFDHDKELGIHSKIKSVLDLIKCLDHELYQYLEENKIFDEGNLQIIIFKWITLLFAQEFKINEVIWLWDRFLSDCERFEMVIFCSVSRLIIDRDFFLSSKKDEIMEKLQNIKTMDPEEIFVKADELRRKFYKNEKK